MNWFFKQGYPPELIDEFMAEQDIYEDQYYEEDGYYDENGDWVECEDGHEIFEDDYGFNAENGQILDPDPATSEGAIQVEVEAENEEDEEFVPSPPPQSEPHQTPQPGPIAKINGSTPKAANDVIDKDLKAAQDAAKAAGDVAKNLIGGIGGSLLGGFSGGKKSGGFGLGSLLGAPSAQKPHPQNTQKPVPQATESKTSVKVQSKDLTQTAQVSDPTKMQPALEKDETNVALALEDKSQTQKATDVKNVVEDGAAHELNLEKPKTNQSENQQSTIPNEGEGIAEMAFREAKPPTENNPPIDIAKEQVPVEVLEAEAEKVVEIIKSTDSDGEKSTPDGKQVAFAEDGRPKFVKHINKTRTMSGRQKWDWAFEKIIQVRPWKKHSKFNQCTKSTLICTERQKLVLFVENESTCKLDNVRLFQSRRVCQFIPRLCVVAFGFKIT